MEEAGGGDDSGTFVFVLNDKVSTVPLIVSMLVDRRRSLFKYRGFFFLLFVKTFLSFCFCCCCCCMTPFCCFIFCCFNGLEDQLLVLRCCDLRRCFCQCVICVLEESDGGSGVAFATAVVVVVAEEEEEEKEVVVEGGLLQTGFRLCADEEDVVDAG